MTVQSGIVCAGNWIVDIIHDISEWPKKSDLVIITDQTIGVGGGGANVAFNLAALQVDYPVWPAGLLGCDTHGDLVRRACQDAGLPVEHLGTITEVCTAHTHVMNVTGDSRTFFYNAGANAHFDARHFIHEGHSSSSTKHFLFGISEPFTTFGCYGLPWAHWSC